MFQSPGFGDGDGPNGGTHSADHADMGTSSTTSPRDHAASRAPPPSDADGVAPASHHGDGYDAGVNGSASDSFAPQEATAAASTSSLSVADNNDGLGDYLARLNLEQSRDGPSAAAAAAVGADMDALLRESALVLERLRGLRA